MKKKISHTRILSLAALMGLLYSSSFAQTTVTLKAVKDNTIFSEGSKSNGTGSYLFVGKTEATVNGIRRALIQFDVASIPANATITDVKLQLTGSKANATNVEAHRVTTTWGKEPPMLLVKKAAGLHQVPMMLPGPTVLSIL